MKSLKYRVKRYYKKRIVPYVRKTLGIDELEDNIYTLLNSATDITKCRPATGDLRILQLAGVELLKLFDLICRRESCTYWLEWGTLLGAVRHKGYIPWDDDLDVCMPREDYLKIIPVLSDYFAKQEGFYVQDPEQAKTGWFWIDYWNAGLHLDIFPIDSMTVKKGTSPDEIREAVIACRKTGEKRDDLCTVKDPNESEKIFYYSSVIWEKSNYFNTDKIFPLREIPFETHLFFAPFNSDLYLSNEYGNYMEYPHSRILIHKEMIGNYKETGTDMEQVIQLLQEKQAEFR